MTLSLALRQRLWQRRRLLRYLGILCSAAALLLGFGRPAHGMTPQDILDNTALLASTIRMGFSTTWVAVLGSDLYVKLGNIGVAIGLLGFGLWAYRWWSLINQEGEIPTQAFQELAPILLLVVLLGNPTNRGQLLGQVSMAINDVSYNISREVLTGLNDIASGSPVTEIGVQNAARLTAEVAIRECSQLPEEELRRDCFAGARERISEIVQPFGAPPNFRPWSTTLLNELNQQIEEAREATETRDGRDLFSFFARGAGGLVSNITSTVGLGWLLLTGTAFLFAIEIIALATAILGPLALGVSLTPLGFRPALGWFSAYAGLAVVRVTYAVVVALAGLIFSVSGGSIGGATAPLIVGLFGPLFALWLGRGGGIAVFNGLLNISALLIARS